MKAVVFSEGLKVRVVDSPIPVPEADQVIIKVVVSGSNPKDWKYPNQGDDIAGVIYAVGSNVMEFREGDRVAAFHQMMTLGGSFAEYAVAWSHTTFHIPQRTTYEEAATIPLAAMTAAFGLYQRLSLPLPWHPTTAAIPLIIYGAATAVGSFAIQMAVQSNIHPLICIAGRGTAHVKTLINEERGDVVLDYRKGDDNLVHDLQSAIQNVGGQVNYAFDCVSEHNSFQNISHVLDPKTGQITLILPGRDYSAIPDTVTKSTTFVGQAHGDTEWQEKTGTMVGNEEFAYTFFRYFSRGLSKGFFKPHPFEVVPGGLEGIQTGLENLKEGKASALKYVFRIADTEGVARK